MLLLSILMSETGIIKMREGNGKGGLSEARESQGFFSCVKNTSTVQWSSKRLQEVFIKNSQNSFKT